MVDVVVRLHDPTDPSTERTAPPSSAHVQLDDDPRTLIQQSIGDEFRQHDGVVTMMMFYRRRASPSSTRGRGVAEGEGGARDLGAAALPPLYIGALGGALSLEIPFPRGAAA